MSGFLAVRADDGPVDARAIDAIIAASTHRGAARAWSEGNVTLVAFDGRRGSGLAVGEDFVVAADARIDNRAEIGVAGASDAELLRNVWRRWGAGGLERVTGDFAGAVYDRKRKELHVFRDPCAGRHALLARAHGSMIAATSIPMLLADPDLPREIDEAWVAAYLTGSPGFATASGYRAIARLRPGWVARAGADGWKARAWFTWRVKRVRERSDAAYAERFRELLQESVRCRIDGAARVGVSLSGGLDSTSVAAAARAVRADVALVALALPFAEPKADEQPLQRAAAERVGAELLWAPLGDGNPFGAGPFESLHMFGVPPVASNQFYVDRIVRASADTRIDVALDGIDGDAAVGGNWLFLSDLLVTGRWRALTREARAITRVHGVPPRVIARAYVLGPLAPPQMRRDARAPEWMDAAFARAHGARRAATTRWRPGRSFAAAEEISPDVAPAVLEAIDETWARCGIEAAHPFMDRRLVEFCLGLPRAQKVRSGITKVILRNALRGALPADVVDRAAKAELSGSFFTGLFGSGRPWVEEGLSLAVSNPSHWVSSEGAARLAERFRKGRDGLDAFRVGYVAQWLTWLEEGSPQGEAEGAAG